jgi:hypothetical protein
MSGFSTVDTRGTLEDTPRGVISGYTPTARVLQSGNL